MGSRERNLNPNEEGNMVDGVWEADEKKCAGECNYNLVNGHV